jgi:hypothetical protein
VTKINDLEQRNIPSAEEGDIRRNYTSNLWRKRNEKAFILG